VPFAERWNPARRQLAQFLTKARYPLDERELLFDTYECKDTTAVRLSLAPNRVPESAIEAFCRRHHFSQDAVQVESIERTGESPLNTELYAHIRKTAERFYPKTTLIPHITPGFSDNRFLRQRGIPVYGFFPLSSAEEARRQHATDERLSLGALHQAVKIAVALIEAFCAKV
jgi:acetylornithine deacetylase/succinyl-diaminopimelate desuccinylase-like protein